MTTHSALERMAAWPRLALASLPTPLVALPHLSTAIADPGPEILVKMDADTGFALGGNKVRKLEFSLADAKARGRDPVITVGAVGSNHVLATTIYAGTAGLGAVGLFIPQAVQENLRTNILCNRHNGCENEQGRDKKFWIRAVHESSLSPDGMIDDVVGSYPRSGRDSIIVDRQTLKRRRLR